jgi:hypothetical protein
VYRKAQLFEDRLHKIGSDSLLMDKAGEQAKILGDPNKEYYATFTQTRESRAQLNNLLQEVIPRPQEVSGPPGTDTTIPPRKEDPGYAESREANDAEASSHVEPGFHAGC